MNSEKDALRQEMVNKDRQLAAIAEKTEEAKKSQQTGFEFRIKGLFKLAEDEMLLNQVLVCSCLLVSAPVLSARVCSCLLVSAARYTLEKCFLLPLLF
jgi:hypothetical protein